MALSQEDKAEIAEIIRGTLKSGCACGLSLETSIEVGHFYGRIRDIGEGNLNKGIEDFAAAVRMVSSWRRFGERVGGLIAVAVCMAVVGGVGTLLVIGLKEWFTAQK